MVRPIRPVDDDAGQPVGQRLDPYGRLDRELDVRRVHPQQGWICDERRRVHPPPGRLHRIRQRVHPEPGWLRRSPVDPFEGPVVVGPPQLVAVLDLAEGHVVLDSPGPKARPGAAAEPHRGDPGGGPLAVGLGDELAAVVLQRVLGVVDGAVGDPPLLGELLEVRPVPERAELLEVDGAPPADVGDPRPLPPQTDGDLVECLDIGAVGDLPAHVPPFLPLTPSLESPLG